MREIKFRGRGAPRGKQWFYGDLDTQTSGVCILDNDTLHTVISETVGQFTGLRDCKRQEIYEGDILSFLPPRMLLTTRIRIIAPVQYRDDGFFVVLSHCDYSLKYILQRDPSAHVIGNIHDNPELLEVEA